MPYWFLDKEKDEPMIFGSLPVLSNYLGYSENDRTLSIHFSEKKKKSLITDKYRIERVKLKRSARKKSVGKKNMVDPAPTTDESAET
jgi:hypothetical protein